MIPAEARAVIDTMESVKHSEDKILDAVYCLQRIVSRSQRDRNRIAQAYVHLGRRAQNEEQPNV